MKVPTQRSDTTLKSNRTKTKGITEFAGQADTHVPETPEETKTTNKVPQQEVTAGFLGASGAAAATAAGGIWNVTTRGPSRGRGRGKSNIYKSSPSLRYKHYRSDISANYRTPKEKYFRDPSYSVVTNDNEYGNPASIPSRQRSAGVPSQESTDVDFIPSNSSAYNFEGTRKTDSDHINSCHEGWPRFPEENLATWSMETIPRPFSSLTLNGTAYTMNDESGGVGSHHAPTSYTQSLGEVRFNYDQNDGVHTTDAEQLSGFLPAAMSYSQASYNSAEADCLGSSSGVHCGVSHEVQGVPPGFNMESSEGNFSTYEQMPTETPLVENSFGTMCENSYYATPPLQDPTFLMYQPYTDNLFNANHEGAFMAQSEYTDDCMMAPNAVPVIYFPVTKDPADIFYPHYLEADQYQSRDGRWYYQDLAGSSQISQFSTAVLGPTMYGQDISDTGMHEGSDPMFFGQESNRFSGLNEREVQDRNGQGVQQRITDFAENMKDNTGTILSYSDTKFTEGFVQAQTRNDRTGPIYSSCSEYEVTQDDFVLSKLAELSVNCKGEINSCTQDPSCTVTKGSEANGSTGDIYQMLRTEVNTLDIVPVSSNDSITPKADETFFSASESSSVNSVTTEGELASHTSSNKHSVTSFKSISDTEDNGADEGGFL